MILYNSFLSPGAYYRTIDLKNQIKEEKNTIEHKIIQIKIDN